MSQTIFITGANRGIGLALSTVLLEGGHTVIGACRKPETLKALASKFPNLKPVALDVSDDASAAACASATAKLTDRLDAVCNIAGVMPQPYDAKLEDLDFQVMLDCLETNLIGPLRVAKALLPLLRKGKNPRLLNMTSGLGSIGRTDNPNFYAYGASKAALNKVTRTESFALKADGVTVVTLDPGWVKTDMGGPNAQLEPRVSASAIAATLLKLDLSWTGKFLYNDGTEIPW